MTITTINNQGFSDDRRLLFGLEPPSISEQFHNYKETRKIPHITHKILFPDTYINCSKRPLSLWIGGTDE